MLREVLSHSPILALPLAAMFLFITVFALVVTRTMTRRREHFARVARLPLDREEDRHER